MNTFVNASNRTTVDTAVREDAGTSGSLSVLELVPTPVVTAQRDWTILSVNAAWESLTGWNRSKVIGTRLHEWVQPVDEVRLQQLSNLPSGTAANSNSRWDVGIRTQGGGWAWVDLVVQWTPPGELDLEEGRFLCTLTDVSNRRRHEERLRQALENERGLVRRTHQFVAMASHEVRLPLANIGYAAELMSAAFNPQQSERQQRYLKSILENVARLNRLSDQLALSGQIESGHWHFAPVSLDFRELCRTAASLMEPERRTSRIRLDLPGTPLRGQADPQLLELALSNLVSNAVKYSPPDAEVLVGLNLDGEFVEIRVSDCGPGIRAEDAVRLFQPFQRGSHTGTAKGSGLGLVICRTCVGLHGGTLEWNRRAGGGTEFLIRIPAPGAGPTSP